MKRWKQFQPIRFTVLLLTDNFETTAQFKLNLAGLSEYFDVPGAFGDQSFDRHELPKLATQRVSGQLRMEGFSHRSS